ncbi:MAG TPA: hypothetical protein VGG20_10940 [Thermoanaerobaculia bacterium]|jgi:hypothetical protein
MSFKSMDLMIDVLPTGKFTALLQPAGLGLCTIGTATTGGDDEEDGDDKKDDDLACTQATANTGPTSVSRQGLNLAALQRQLREALAS